jgi:hypothetical protein
MHDARCSSALGLLAAGNGRGDRERTQEMTGLDELRGCGGMTWSEAEQGWAAAPEEIVRALSSDGFEECKREVTTSRRDSRAAGGVWQGVNTRTGAVASAIWVNRLLWPQATVFITVDGEALRGDTATPEPDSRHEDGGEA